MEIESLYGAIQRYKTLYTDRISVLPIVILMPHSACNCRCVMCDIWKDNRNVKQLTEADISGLVGSLKQFGTRQVVMSGGEALLNPNFFGLCEILQRINIKVTLLTTGLSLKSNAEDIVRWVDEIIVSLDGDKQIHNQIRNVPCAFEKLEAGISYVKAINPNYKITARTVIHSLNFRNWTSIIESAENLGLNQISFLPADVSSHAFNRQIAWNQPRQNEILIAESDLDKLREIIEEVVLIKNSRPHFIAESAAKLRNIYFYYASFYGLNAMPFKKCNAPWVSAVVEADGEVRPCFFHESIGNIHDADLTAILNGDKAKLFRKSLKVNTNEICVKCVCSLNLNPLAKI
jgi:MoaA/NifB/PqqE/SkfB family radical SAM enzyme